MLGLIFPKKIHFSVLPVFWQHQLVTAGLDSFKNTPNSKSVWTAEPLRLVLFYLMPTVAPNEKHNFTKIQQVCLLDTKWHIIS